MIYSMTGFGRASMEQEGVTVSCEIRSVNHRFCEVSLRLPKSLSTLELKLKQLIQKHIDRGKINVYLSWETDIAKTDKITLNEEVAAIYLQLFQDLKRRFGLSGEIDLNLLATLPDILKHETEETDPDHAYEMAEAVLLAAIANLNQMRQTEGNQLAQDLRDRIATIEATLLEIEARAPQRLVEAKATLEERVQSLLENQSLDEQRLMTEIAFLAERIDITEECVRFHSHNKQFIEALDTGGAVGKRLNFIVQEMNREANTIGSKANDTAILERVIQIKEELEKIREQIQNIA
ncbi:MAG: YicC family protein [Gemmatimonadetes bacterium]|nr:MAG: YicC family protein [Gemmatimonadota bacterium]